MTVKKIAYELENLQNETEKIHSLQNALFEAIYNGNNTPETYEWAFILLGDLTREVKNRLDKVGKELFAVIKNEKKEVA